MWKIIKLAWKNRKLKEFLIVLAISLRDGKISEKEKEELVNRFAMVMKDFLL